MNFFRKAILKEIDRQIEIRKMAMKMILDYKTDSFQNCMSSSNKEDGRELWRGYYEVKGAMKALEELKEII